MKDTKFIKGDTIDKQMDSIERSLVRLSRRVHSSVIIATPPSIISNYEKVLPEDGIVFRTIFPCDGVLKAIESFSTTNSKSRSTIDIYVINTLQQTTMTLSNINDVSVKKGDMVAIKMSGDPELCNIWTSILFVANYKKGSYDSIALDHLDSVSESIIKGE